jgi:hypothetical protein
LIKLSNQREQINLLNSRPAHNVEFESGDDQRIVLLIPKFKNKLLVKYFLPQLRSQNFRIQLDEYGSFIWDLCDGNTPVAEISDKMKEKFGENFDPNYERIGKFINQLIRDKFLTLENPA